MRHTLLKRWRFRGSPHSARKWIPFAEKKAEQLYDNKYGRPGLFMRLPGGITLSIEVIRRTHQALITLISEGGSGDYQFIGSAEYLYRTYEDPDVTDRMCPLVYATKVSARNGNFTATPLCSSVEAPPDAEWVYDADPLNTNDYLYWTPLHQPDGLGNRQWFGLTNSPSLATQYQQGVPLHAFGAYGSSSTAYLYNVDMGFDFGPLYFTGLEGQNKSPDSDWYQSAAIRTVTDETYGTRSFIIMVDSTGTFFCYPVNSPDDPQAVEWVGEKANVDPTYTQSDACPWPAWVTHEDVGTIPILASVPTADHIRRLRPMWSFNHDGTRAACIAAHRDANWSDAYFDSSYYSVEGAFQYDLLEDYPGMVEVDFDVTLTGADLENFTFTVTIAQDIYSKTDMQCPVAVGYTNRKIGTVPENALVMLEYKHYTDNPRAAILSLDPENPSPDLYDIIRPNLATVAVLSYQQESSWVSIREWLAHYACFPRRPYGRGTEYVEPRKFSPIAEDFPELSGETYDESTEHNFFTYIAQITSLDLDSLSVGLAIAVTEEVGFVSLDTYSAEAIVGIVISGNVQVQKKQVGHPLLISAAEDLYALTATYPDISSMTRFHLNATADYTHYNPSWDSGNWKDYATMDITDGAGGSWSSLVQNASEDASVYEPVPNTGLFTDYIEITRPVIFRMVDTYPFIRPGMRWEDTTELKPGTISFTGFPYAVIHHQSILFLTLNTLHTYSHRIRTHRSGSFAYFIGPFCAQTEMIQAIEGGVTPDIPNTFDQFIMDKIGIVDNSGNLSAETTHLAMFNSAFGKSLTESDYYFTLSLIQTPPEDIGPPYVEPGPYLPYMKPASDDPTAHEWHIVALGGAGVVTTNQTLIFSGPWKSYLFNNFCFGRSFMILQRHASYSAVATFPHPALEGAFP